MKFEVEGKTLKVTGSGKFYAKLGTMVAYKGDFRFEKDIFGPGEHQGGLGGLIGKVAKQTIRAVTGEKLHLMRVEGEGECYIADEACNIHVIELEPSGIWREVYVESSEVLALTDKCNIDVVMLKTGALGSRGLFMTKISYGGEKSIVAIKTKGEPITLKAPCVVDPDALLAWTGKEPRVVADVTFKTLIGKSSGETFKLSFEEQDQTVIVQPAERVYLAQS
ncbi:AIM24 family protein [Peptococcaceae bacterium]|nr:AIM24 family protein [Peptococcaceae bacterium]MCL0106574.1 AIM24 family protein [Peptococcaceae bacterium]